MSVAGLSYLQSAAGIETGPYSPRPQANGPAMTVVTGPVGTNPVKANSAVTTGEVFHAVSNRSPSVITRRTAVSPKMASPNGKASSHIQQVSAVKTGTHPAAANPVVFASHPVCQVKYSQQKSDASAFSLNRKYANLSPLACEKLTQATPLVIDTSASASVPAEIVDSAEGSTYLEELNQLAPNLAEADSETTTESYVSELNSLLHGPSPWILARGGMVDLRPEDPEPVGTSETYINELRGLVADSQDTSVASTQHRSSKLTSFSGALIQQQRPMAAPKKTYVIPQQEPGFCESPGSKTVDGLFAPLSVVGVSGNSTAPPEVPREAKQIELDLPKNLACSYLQSGIPGYYLTRGYGTRRAPRNTHRFYNNPLYFEDPNLERCGQSNGCLTTFTSAIQFATMAALLPYQTAADHPRDCVPALPDCPTCQSFGPDAYFPEWSWKAAAVQGAAVTGLIFVIP